MRILRTVVTTTVTTLALAVDASAASVKVDADCSVRYYCSWHVTYTAAPGSPSERALSLLALPESLERPVRAS